MFDRLRVYSIKINCMKRVINKLQGKKNIINVGRYLLYYFLFKINETTKLLKDNEHG